MNIIDQFNRTFGLTKNEGRIVLFLVAMLLVGSAVKLLRGTGPADVTYDYASVDSQFRVLTEASTRSIDSEGVGGRAAMPSDASSADREGNYAEMPVKAPVDLNAATREQLELLPGVGPALADRILEYRQRHGKFTSLQELLDVKGIGQKKFEQIRPLITLGSK